MSRFRLLRVGMILVVVAAFGAELYAQIACPTGCHKVPLEYFTVLGTVTEYDPPKARNQFATPAPDGGLYQNTQDPYRLRSYGEGGDPFCVPCGASSASSAAGQPGAWVQIPTGLGNCDE